MTIFYDEMPKRHADIFIRSVEMANELLKNSEFFQAIYEHNTFDYSDTTPAIISDLMKGSDLKFKVTTFHPHWLEGYGRTLAYTDSRFSNTLFLNDKKLNRDPEEVAASIIHESVHALDDDKSNNYRFGHGDDSPIGKENSAPYWIGNLAYQMLVGNSEAPLLAFDQPRLDQDGQEISRV